MRYVNVALFLFLLVLACQALSVSKGADQANQALYSRGSSPGGSPEHHGGSGLLGDIVAQGTKKRPAPGASLSSSSSHPAQSTHGHPQQTHPFQSHFLQGHPAQGHPMQSHLNQGHPLQTHLMQNHPMSSMQDHTLHTHSMLGHPVQGHPVSHTLQNQFQSHTTQGHPLQSYPTQGHPLQSHVLQGHPGSSSHQDRLGHPTGLSSHYRAVRTKEQLKMAQIKPSLLTKTPGLAHLAAGLSTAGKPTRVPSTGRRPGRPTLKPDDPPRTYNKKPKGDQAQPKVPKQRGPQKGRPTWWKTAGGLPERPKGTSPMYEQNQQRWQKLKFQKLLKNPPDVGEHPSPPHHPGPHGGPPSPDAGSHAVSKRRLAAFEQELKV